MIIRSIFFIVFCFGTSAASLFNPKIIGKFNYLKGQGIGKHAGAVALENEFFSFLSAGIQLGAGLGKFSNSDEQITSSDTVFIDAGLYVKPQLAIDLTAVILTPYISFYLGIPSFSQLKPKNFVFTHNYSTMVGLELTLFKHMILLTEVGISAVKQMVETSKWHFPYLVTAGLGYRF